MDADARPEIGSGTASALADDRAYRFRLRFAKRGDLRFVGHQDLMRCLERTLRRAEIPMAYSRGFNPRPRMTFPLALALGIEGLREVLELELSRPMDAAELEARLASALPEGFDVSDAEQIGVGDSGRVTSASYAIAIPESKREAAGIALDRFLASEHWPHARVRRERTVEVDLRPSVRMAALGPGGTLHWVQEVDPSGSARPEEFLEALGLRELLGEGSVLTRTDVELAPPRPRHQP